jgi:hypothetical protein
MQRREIVLGFLSAGLLAGSMVANATLTAVTGADGRQMLNDSTLNVTWADAVPSARGDWFAAQAWVASLNVEAYGGYTNWRLAEGRGTATPSASTCTPITPPNEFGCLFFFELDNPMGSVTTPIPATKLSPFTNLSSNDLFWSNTSYLTNSCLTGGCWTMRLDIGAQVPIAFATVPCCEAMAVRSGQVAPGLLLAALLKEVTGVGPGKSLAEKVALAQTYYAVPDIEATCAVLSGFVDAVKELAGKKISPQLDATIVANARVTKAAIGCHKDDYEDD